jgi:hypothetical protein
MIKEGTRVAMVSERKMLRIQIPLMRGIYSSRNQVTTNKFAALLTKQKPNPDTKVPARK